MEQKGTVLRGERGEVLGVIHRAWDRVKGFPGMLGIPMTIKVLFTAPSRPVWAQWAHQFYHEWEMAAVHMPNQTVYPLVGGFAMGAI